MRGFAAPTTVEIFSYLETFIVFFISSNDSSKVVFDILLLEEEVIGLTAQPCVYILGVGRI